MAVIEVEGLTHTERIVAICGRLGDARAKAPWPWKLSVAGELRDAVGEDIIGSGHGDAGYIGYRSVGELLAWAPEDIGYLITVLCEAEKKIEIQDGTIEELTRRLPKDEQED